jgi:hypothetical protein
MTPGRSDPLLASLAELPAAAPADGHTRRVRARCHATLTASPQGSGAPRSRAQRAADAGFAIAAGLYGVATLVEALRIAIFL